MAADRGCPDTKRPPWYRNHGGLFVGRVLVCAVSLSAYQAHCGQDQQEHATATAAGAAAGCERIILFFYGCHVNA